jgi:hypothetical protein
VFSREIRYALYINQYLTAGKKDDFSGLRANSPLRALVLAPGE